ncbi:MAG TPA: GNAT family N-acetyltransferase, partial [Anaerolineaceae bacterium]|nr:GNAT family N-acetyltransferase [Anaerolineaceae bacterium]
MEVTIRPMAVEDIPQVHEIDVRSFPLPWSERSYLFEVRENQSSRCWVAEVEEDGRRLVAGMLVLWLLVDEAHIGTIAVHPDYRQHRIGQRLLAAGLLDAHASGAQKSFL